MSRARSAASRTRSNRWPAPATLVTLVLALLLLGVLIRLVTGLVRDFWVIVVAMMQL